MELDALDVPWPAIETLLHLGLALAIGLFVGLDRERRGKEAGLRTFGFAALLGGLGGLAGDGYALLSLALIGLLVVLFNWQTLQTGEGTQLTTSAALLVVGFAGVLAGKGQTFVPVAIAVASAALLAWKESLADFTLGLTDSEIRSAILLGILAFIIYPVLPEAPVDPWGLIEPREAWVTVILIAALGFVNYVLLKLYGTRGVEITGFLGGVVNSTVTVAELGGRVRDSEGQLRAEAYRGVMFATAAMLLRNGVLLGALARDSLLAVAVPLGVMLVATVLLAAVTGLKSGGTKQESPSLSLESPFSLKSALKFGVLFLVLEVAATVGQTLLGSVGFYAVSVAGGLVSSASAVASAGTLAAHGQIEPHVAGIGAVLASLASVAVTLPLIWRVSEDRGLTARLAGALAVVAVAGIGAVLVAPLFSGLPL